MRLACFVLCLAVGAPHVAAQEVSSAPAPEGLLEGVVINEVTKEAVRKAQVTLSPGNAAPAVTDANGHFAFRNLAAGTYMLHAQHPEYPVIVAGLAAARPRP